MKKLFTLLLALLLVLALASCGKTNEPAGEETPGEEIVEPGTDNSTGEQSPAQTLRAAFEEAMNSGTAYTPGELAELLVGNEIIGFSGATNAVEPGLLSGFDTEITGFSEGASFGPMIGSIPFVGYVFSLEDGADVAAFEETLKSSANPRWNVCVEADETVVDAVGNTVFFLMAPASLED